MDVIRNFNEANVVLAKFAPHDGAAKAYTLDRMQALMTFLGNPQNALNIIHVAGTSGKTSTCYYAAALLQAAGHTVGLTVSPHVLEVNERLQINLTPLPETEFCLVLSEFLILIKDSGITPTYFELLVALAYYEFAKRKVDFVVMEVGLGGLLDGTNVVSNPDKVCIITDIGLDHVNILGHTLPEIAVQKVGIIMKGNPVFCYRQAPEINNVFTKRSKEVGAKLYFIDQEPISSDFDFLPLFQKRNFGLACSAINFTLQRDNKAPLTKEQLLQGAHTLVPGRMEKFNYKDKVIILDGAHNAQKLAALSASINAQYKHQPLAALVGFAAHREASLESSLQVIISLADYIVATSFRTGQDLLHDSVGPQKIVATCHHQHFYKTDAVIDPKQALGVLLARPEPVLLITGSLYLLYHLRPLLLELDND